MTKQELARHAGGELYALCTRPGGMFKDIYCLTRYRVTERGTLKYVREVLSCVANRRQCELLDSLTGGNYVEGRPTAERISAAEIDQLII